MKDAKQWVGALLLIFLILAIADAFMPEMQVHGHSRQVTARIVHGFTYELNMFVDTVWYYLSPWIITGFMLWVLYWFFIKK